MRLIDAAAPVFARHETFHPRYSWFRKAYTNTEADPKIFCRDDATVRIGVGKNMVRSIRFWGLAAKLIVEKNRSVRTTREYKPTPTGNAIFGKYGSDRYLEDIGTLWLIHWLLLAPRSKLPVWWIAFNEFSAIEFSENELESAVLSYLNSVPEFSTPSQSSIRKDVSALLRTYTSARQKNAKFDDYFDCPLRELNLISYSNNANRYRFSSGPKDSLSPEVLAFSILNYIARTDSKAQTILISSLVHESGSPGKILKLTESEIITKLNSLNSIKNSLELTSVAGAPQLVWSDNPIEIGNEILSAYYHSPKLQLFDCGQSIQATTTK